MEIDPDAPVTASKQIFIDAKPEKVWKVLTDINSWSAWNPDVSTSYMSGSVTVGAEFQWKSGNSKFTSNIQVLQPNRKLGWTGVSRGTIGIHVWELRPRQNGTLIKMEESMDGWYPTLMKFKLRRMLDRSLDIWLEQMKNVLEEQIVAA